MSDTTELLKSRIHRIGTTNTVNDNGKAVLYIASRDLRLRDNAALYSAQRHALQLKLPLVVGFVLYPKAARTAREHYTFLIDGLGELSKDLKTKNIPLIYRVPAGKPIVAAEQLVKDVDPAVVYTDFSPLPGPRAFKTELATRISMPLYVVDTHNIVPVWVASDKQEVGARTLRTKIHKVLHNYLTEDDWSISKHPHTLSPLPDAATLNDLREAVSNVKPNGTKHSFAAGESAAQAELDDFLQKRLKGYADLRNDPSNDHLSNLSPYLHFGQLASLHVIRAVAGHVSSYGASQADADALIEEMVVRKELSDNFCYYTPHPYDLSGIPDWAKKSIKKHAKDPREHVYSLAEFEAGKTHDDAWNAAQRQLTRTGKIHGYMRMYWAKKVLEWSDSADDALETLLYLNDFYHLDGRDPNGYVGILWSIGGLHDRPWQERPVFGVIRSMVYNGLKRKFDIQKYIDDNS